MEFHSQLAIQSCKNQVWLYEFQYRLQNGENVRPIDRIYYLKGTLMHKCTSKWNNTMNMFPIPILKYFHFEKYLKEMSDTINEHNALANKNTYSQTVFTFHTARGYQSTANRKQTIAWHSLFCVFKPYLNLIHPK